MATSRLFSCIACLLCFLTGCQKKEQKIIPRCIYDQPAIAQVFVQAVQEQEQFSHFKKNPFFNLLWENLTSEEGEVWLCKIQSQYPFLIEKFDSFRQNDSVGSPRVYPYGSAGLFSPSTLRVAAIAGDLKQRLKDFSQLRIVQIGAECGSLCKILHDLSPCASFTIVDLPEQLLLAKMCLDILGLRNIVFLTPEELSKNDEYDLVISDMSFSEFNRSLQELFFDRILSRSRSGYLLGRIFPKHFGVIALNADELKTRFERFGKFSEWEMHEPSIDRENYFIYWKR